MAPRHFKPEPLPLEYSGALGYTAIKPINQPGPVLVTANEQPQKGTCVYPHS